MELDLMDILGIDNEKIETISILAGVDKFGNKENFDKITIKTGEIITIVGATGSGKSRLLGDIEWGAQEDTPTKRTILVNDKPIDLEKRFSPTSKLVAQLSQNMNFVMDLTVEEFLQLHAESRMIENKDEIVEKIFIQANELAGERFLKTTPITSLSGGQSRSLMIADTALLSSSPIILIDEIENAGVDRKKALELLVGNDKIVLIATHDPILALMGDKRFIIKNGGIDSIIETTDEEKKVLERLIELDKTIYNMREKLRDGKSLSLNSLIK